MVGNTDPNNEVEALVANHFAFGCAHLSIRSGTRRIVLCSRN